MRSVIKKIWGVIARFQVTAVIVAFAVMVVSSYLYVSDIERKNLQQNVKDVISYTEANIKAVLLEPETILAGISETIQGMILQGDDAEVIQRYVQYINNYAQKNEAKRLSGVIGFYGIFDVYGNTFIAGDADCISFEDGHNLHDCPWYQTAVEAGGDIGITSPHIDTASGEGFMTFSRRIFDENGEALGVVCLDINLDRIQMLAVNTQFAGSGFGLLLNEELEIIAHPYRSLLGMDLRDVTLGIASYYEEIRQKGFVSERTIIDYLGVKSISYIERFQNGWYLGLIMPQDKYYQSTKNLVIMLVFLGLILSSVLINILLRISSEKNKADERVRIMFDTMPLGASYHGKNFKVIDCNQSTLDFFGLATKQEYIDRFYDLSPERQPNGKLSRECIVEYVDTAYNEGYCIFEWIHRNVKGVLIPCEVTLVSVKHDNEFIIVAYVRDLRELKQMMEEVQQREDLLNTVNSAAAILLSVNDENSFEAELLKSFDLVGNCLDVDRVQIWRNEEIDGELHFVYRYEWLSEYGKNAVQVPIGLHFPYSVTPGWESLFLSGGYINAPLAELPGGDRAFLSSYEIKSIVIIPIFLEEKFWGFFSIIDCRKERSFSDDEIRILSSLGLMMSSAVNRHLQDVKLLEADKLKRSLSIMENILNGIDASIYVTIPDTGEILFINDYMKKLFKLGPDCIGQYCYKLFVNSDKKCDFCPCYKLDKDPHSAVVWERANEVAERVLHCIDRYIEWYDGRIVHIHHSFDVTELITAKEQAEQSSHFKTQFLSRMSHEIRTPMNAILGITEIQLQNETLQPDIQESLSRISNSSYLLLGIINDILDLSKIETGKLEITPHPYDTASLINDTVNLNIVKYDSKPINFNLQVDKNIPSTLVGDELRIKQILNNLLSNAFKYTEKGEIIMSVTIERQQGESSEVTLVFRVTDTGHGMTDEQLDKLFDEYTRFNMETNRKVEGAGLGMSITKHLIRLMDGNILVESEFGKGTVFTVRLPQETIGADVLGEEIVNNLVQFHQINKKQIRKTVQITREYMPYGKVLIVDDMESNLYVARGLMSPYCLSIETAISGDEAVEKIKSGSVFDIIFMDHFMPKMDGIDTTKAIRELGYKNPIIALTANALTGMAEIFIENGFDGFIAKPIDLRQLNSYLNKFVRDKYPPEVVKAAQKQAAMLKKSITKEEYISYDDELNAIFARDAVKALTRMSAIHKNAYRRTDDIRQFVIDVHAMKSGLASIGEPELSVAAFKLEQAGREGNMQLMMEKTPPFLEELQKVIEKCKPKEDSNDAALEDSDINLAFLREKLYAIKTSCEAYDDITANTAMAELVHIKWSQSVKKTLETISEYLLHSDFDEAAKIAGDYLKNNAPQTV